MKVLRPPFSYYGGKTMMAKDIIGLMPDDAKTYVEPFAGSLAVLLRKEPHAAEVVNDLDARLVAFWRTVRDKTDAITNALSATPYARDEFNHALETIDTETDEIEFARKVFVILRQSRKRSTSAKPGNFRGVGGPPRGAGHEFARAVDSLPRVAERLRNVVIENIDALDLIKRWDKPDTIMYLDPPYVGETRTARDYTVENASVDFHERLIDKIADAQARIILSGYDHPVYDKLSSWRRVDSVRTTGSTSRSSIYAVETLWINY